MSSFGDVTLPAGVAAYVAPGEAMDWVAQQAAEMNASAAEYKRLGRHLPARALGAEQEFYKRVFDISRAAQARLQGGYLGAFPPVQGPQTAFEQLLQASNRLRRQWAASRGLDLKLTANQQAYLQYLEQQQPPEK